MENGRKRGNLDGTFVSNGGFKKSKPDSEYIGMGVGSKSKPCTKFFSTTGCQYGEACHFLHYVPGGINAVSQMTKTGRDSYLPSSARNPLTAPPPSLLPYSDGPSATVKTKLCNKFNTAEGCKFGDQCRFAHGEIELGKRNFPSHDDPRGGGGGIGSMASRQQQPARFESAPQAVANFGVSATAKISIDGSVAGAVIGKGGVISKEICRLTGVRLAVRDHESDPNKKNIELEGTFDQINHASTMVQEILVNVGVGNGNNGINNSNNIANSRQAENVKTRLCENFARGLCTYGEKCRFAHGESDLRQPGQHGA